MKRKLHYHDLPSFAVLSIGVAGLQFPLSVELRQNSDDGEYNDYLDYFDVNSLGDLSDLLTEELTTCLPFTIDLEEIDSASSLDPTNADMLYEQTGIQPERAKPDDE